MSKKNRIIVATVVVFAIVAPCVYLLYYLSSIGAISFNFNYITNQNTGEPTSFVESIIVYLFIGVIGWVLLLSWSSFASLICSVILNHKNKTDKHVVSDESDFGFDFAMTISNFAIFAVLLIVMWF